MKLWNDNELFAIYTLGPVHCGTGQASGAVDLPIAREAHTGFPVLPATMLKGVARDFMESSLDAKDLRRLFGYSLEDSSAGKALGAGALSFTEGKLVAFPVRSLNRPFLQVTCPLILSRLARDLAALGIDDPELEDAVQKNVLPTDHVIVADDSLVNEPLVLEDLLFEPQEVHHAASLRTLAQKLAVLLPAEEPGTRETFVRNLVVVPDGDYQDLMERAIPVRARIKLTAGKTTSKWIDPDGQEDNSGNLWYEEHLPSDCLFIAVIGERRQRVPARSNKNDDKNDDRSQSNRSESTSPLSVLRAHAASLTTVQIGGNETVGHGLCAWTFKCNAKPMEINK